MGADKIYTADNSNLEILTKLGTIEEQAPESFQFDKKIETKFLVEQNMVHFQLANFDAKQKAAEYDLKIEVISTFFNVNFQCYSLFLYI